MDKRQLEAFLKDTARDYCVSYATVKKYYRLYGPDEMFVQLEKKLDRERH